MAVAAASFGCITTFSRLAYDSGANPQTLVMLRFVAFVAVVGGAFLLLGRPFRLGRRGLVASLWLAVTTLMMSAGYLSSIAYIPVSLAATILYTFPLIVALFSSATGRERMTPLKAIALLAAFVGLVIALGPQFDSLNLKGIAAATIAALGVAAAVLFGGKAMREHDPLTVNLHTNLWLLIVMALFIVSAGDPQLPSTALGIVGTAGATLLYVAAFAGWFLSARFISPVRVAAMFNVEPVVTFMAASLVLGEQLTVAQLAGVGLILSALIALTVAGGRRAEAQ